MATVLKGSGTGQKRALDCGGQMQQEGRCKMVNISLVLVGFRPSPDSSVGRALATSAEVPGSIPGLGVLAFFPSY